MGTKKRQTFEVTLTLDVDDGVTEDDVMSAVGSILDVDVRRQLADGPATISTAGASPGTVVVHGVCAERVTKRGSR